MKKIFTLMAAAVMAMTAGAEDYTDKLAITLNGSAPMTSEATISVTPEEGADGTYTIVLNKFSFQGLLIGDVTITGVKGTTTSAAGGYTFFNEVVDQEAAITNGDMIATMLGNKVNVSVKPGSWMNADKMHLVINLPVKIAMLGQDFDVVAVFGDSGYQIPNSDFEAFHTETATAISFPTFQPTESSSDEPNSWHSFMSATGEMKGFVCGTPQTFISDDIRPESKGTKSVKIVSALAMGAIPANGTITTGQMQANSADATSTDNCAFLDLANEAVDGNGDPFYTVINGRPDKLSVWVKFKQGQEQEEYKYATVSAILTNGGYYQDPGDSIAENVVAKAGISTIESNDFTWQKITIPFNYESFSANNAEPRALLVTISTNAQPGVGSSDAENPDSLIVDDIELIYNNNLTALNIKGTDIALEEGKTAYELDGVSGELTLDDVTAEADGQGALINTTIESVEGGAQVTVKVTSNDYLKTNTYTVLVKGVTTGIDKAEATTVNGVKAIYTIDGRRVSSMDAKGIYVVRKTDGTTVKVMNK